MNPLMEITKALVDDFVSHSGTCASGYSLQKCDCGLDELLAKLHEFETKVTPSKQYETVYTPITSLWQAAIDREAGQEECTWWLSFAGHGVILTRAIGFVSALAACHEKGINPGGGVSGRPLEDLSGIRPDHYDRLMSEGELRHEGLIL